MQESSKRAVLRLLETLFAASSQTPHLLDAPSGDGWLKSRLPFPATVDGIDLFASSAPGYQKIFQADLDEGIPTDLPTYDAVLCCEGLEHFGNPSLFLKSARLRLKEGGLLLITTPNIWYPAARLQYLMRGFFPGFPCLAGKIARGSHMHIMPWSYPQLYLYLRLEGFTDIRLHEEELSRPKHAWERLAAVPQSFYCRGRWKKSKSPEERDFWRSAGSAPSLYGRHLIVTGRREQGS